MYYIVSRCTIGMHSCENCWTDVLKDFHNRTKVMGLKCPCGNAEGINNQVSRGQTLVCIGALSLAIWALILQTIVPLHEIGSCHARL